MEKENKAWLKYLSEIEKQQILSLCKDFDDQTLQDKLTDSQDKLTVSSSSNNTKIQPYHVKVINRFRKLRHSFCNPYIFQMKDRIPKAFNCFFKKASIK